MCWTKVQGYIVILLSLLCLSPTTGVTLFEYGPGAGDLELPPPIDMNSALFVDFSKLDLPYDGDFFRNITISQCGNVNFDGATICSAEFPFSSRRGIIGALWGDMRSNGSADTHIYYRETMENSLLVDVGLIIRQIHGVSDFVPTWAFVVTWINIKAYDSPASDLKFQLVLVSDGVKSYAVFLYEYVNDDADKNIGINGEHEVTKISNYDYFCTDDVNGTDLVNMKQSVCQGLPGILSLRTDVFTYPGMCRELFNFRCSTDSDCTSTSGSTTHCPMCNTETGNCVECVSDDDCATTCNTATGFCEGCTADDQCRDPNLPHCDIASGLCKECTNHRHCSGLCTADYRCIECLDDGHCKLTDLRKPVCDSEKCVCLTDDDCDSYRACHPRTRQCVCRGDMMPCVGPGMICNDIGQCVCSDGYIANDGDCILNCDPPCAEDEICSLNRTCLKGCTTDACPIGTQTVKLRGCAKRGQLGGECAFGICFGKNLACNRRSNMCVCSGRCKPKMICLP